MSRLPASPFPSPARKAPSARANRTQATTLAMVAAEAGVSPSTVSRILNGTATVSEARRMAVENAIAKLKFQPNPAARGLATGRSLTIGVVTQALDSPYYGEGLHGIETSLQEQGYVPLFMSGNWNEIDEARCISQLIARRVDGIIFFTGRLPDEALTTFAKQVPIVVSGRRLKSNGLLSLLVDDQAGAALATRHLIEQGHRRIAYIGGPADHFDALERLEGYKQALAEARIAFDPRLVQEGDFREEGAARAINRLLTGRQRFTAVFCANDQMARGAYFALMSQGLRIPEDVSVVGFDDLPASAYMYPALTTVRQSVLTLGQCLARAVIDLINKRRSKVTLPAVELIVRQSTGPARSLKENLSVKEPA